MRSRWSLAALLFLACTAIGAPPVVDQARREVRVPATVHPTAMKRPLGVKGHHAVVWRGGRARPWALFASDVSDHDVRVALERLGARPGENLTIESWTAREDPRNPEPDKRVDGTPIDVFVEWNGKRIPLSDVIEENGHPTPLLDFRYGGNERFQTEFKSGCIVCLYSCPGGAIGNHAHPIRDSVRDGVVYSARRDKLPRSGTKVTIILKPRTEGT